jgi:hypothetical protein
MLKLTHTQERQSRVFNKNETKTHACGQNDQKAHIQAGAVWNVKSLGMHTIEE